MLQPCLLSCSNNRNWFQHRKLMNNLWLCFREICDDTPSSTCKQQFFSHFKGHAYYQKNLYWFICTSVHRSISISRFFQINEACCVGECSIQESIYLNCVPHILHQSKQSVFNKIPTHNYQFNLNSTGIPLGLDTASSFLQPSWPSATPQQFSSTQNFIKPSPAPGHGVERFRLSSIQGRVGECRLVDHSLAFPQTHV